MTPLSPSKWAPWDLTQFSQSPPAAPSYFPAHQRSKISSFSKVILVLGKAKSHRVPNLCRRGAESPGWFGVSSKHSAWDLTHKQVRCRDETANHRCTQLRPSESSDSFCRGMFKLNGKFDTDSLLYWLSHLECNGHTVHMLTQQHLPPPWTSTVMASLFTHAHSSPLSLAARLHRCCVNCSCYVNNGWTFSS